MIRYDYRIPTAFELAGVYWTTFDIVARRPVAGEVIGNNHFVGTLVQRLGITTGSSLGTVTRTCFHSQVAARPGGKFLKLVCQNEMQGRADHGDSGGPVYSGDFDPTTGTGVYLFGITWGGGHYAQFNEDFTWYSPINSIQTDFGPYYSWQTY
jgi:hypothetical protein